MGNVSKFSFNFLRSININNYDFCLKRDKNGFNSKRIKTYIGKMTEVLLSMSGDFS